MKKNNIEKKLMATATVAAAAVAGVSIANNVHADTVTANNSQASVKLTNDQSQAAQKIDEAQTNVNNAQADVNAKQSDLNNANAALTNAQASASAQTQNVASASANVSAASDAAAKAQSAVNSAQSIANNVTPENVASASQAIENQKQTIANDQNAVSEAQKAASDANSDVTSKQSAVDAAQTYVNGKRANVNIASQNVDTAKDALNGDDSKLQEALAKAKLEVIKAQNNVNVASNAVLAAKSTQTSANGTLSIEQKDIDIKSDALSAAQSAASAASAVNSAAQLDAAIAQQNVNEKLAAQSDVRSAYNSAKSALDRIDTNLVYKNESSAHWAVSEAHYAVESKQSEAEFASQAASAANSDVAVASNAKLFADKRVETAQEAADSAAKSAAQADSDYNTATQKVNHLNDKYGINTITLPDGYVDALKNFLRYKDYHKEKFDPNETVARVLSQQIYSYAEQAEAMNHYRHNKTEEKEVVDYRNLTEAQQKDLAIYTADLINQIRNQVGTSNVTVSENAQATTNSIIKNGYNDPNWDAFGNNTKDGKGHNHDFLSNLPDFQSENIGSGLQQWTTTGGSTYKLPIESQTMDSLKESIYHGVTNMMFSDRDNSWEHSSVFAGINLDKATSLGIGFDKYGYTHYEFEVPTTPNGLDANKYDISSSTSYNELTTAKKDQQAKLTIKKAADTASSDAQFMLNNAKTIQENCQNNLIQAQKKAKKANQVLKDAQTALSQVQIKFNAAENAQRVADEAVQNINKIGESVLTNQTKLKQLDSDLSRAQDDLHTKQITAQLAAALLQIANNNVKTAQIAFDNANTNFRAQQQVINNATNVITAQNNLTQAKTQLTIAQSNEQAAQQAVDAFHASDAQKQAAVDKAEAALQTANNELATAQKSLNDANDALAASKKNAQTKEQAVKDAQAKVANDQQVLTGLQDRLADLQNATANLQAAKNALTQAQSNLTKAQTELQAEQSKLAPLSAAVDAAQAKANAAQTAYIQAKDNLTNAQTALQAAKGAYQTDAQKYGNQVVISPITIQAGENVSAPSIANGLVIPVKLHSAPNKLMMVIAASTNGKTADLPQGTTAQWVNASQVAADAQHAGNYAEDVLIAFPDGSTTTVKAQLTVKTVSTVNQNNGSTSTINNHQAGQTQSNHVESIPSADSITATVHFANVTSGNANSSASVTMSTMSREQYKASQKQASQLPQTSNKNESVLSIIGLTLAASTVSLFSLRKRQN